MSTVDFVAGLFSDYRAEWPSGHFAEHFVQPAYFAKLESVRPCFLFGGRGTGKTTALRSLRFDAAQYRLSRGELESPAVDCLPYLGIYLRMDKNQVRAFDGPELSPRDWGRVFTHYFNLLACREFCELLTWVRSVRVDLQQPQAEQLHRVRLSLQVEPRSDGIEALHDAIDEAIIATEIYINNPSRAQAPVLSIAERSVRAFAELISSLPWAADKPVFCCIDEYENLPKLHQSIINTYVKHSKQPLSYKIGVRSNGLHSHATIDDNDPLQTPDDFLEIDIPQEGFEYFARRVAETRLERAANDGLPLPASLEAFLPALSIESEAALLGVERVVERVLKQAAGAPDLQDFLAKQPPARVALLAYWHDAHPEDSLDELAADWMQNQSSWSIRWGNYSHSLLFWLSKGRKGGRIKKYYAGASTFIHMASGNIRYFIELLDRSIIAELESRENVLANDLLTISPHSQTVAAQTVGKKRLEQLEGVSENGVRLKRLVLGIGRVFLERTRTAGTAPEQNAFTVTGTPESVDQIIQLLEDGVSHLVFESSQRTKRTSEFEPADCEYRIHPIYCALFHISHRKKRRVSFDADALIELISNPSSGIAALYPSQTSDEADLPEQLGMFAAFYRKPN